jgi:hypothetical protein
MTHEELKYKERVLRECFKEKLAGLNVDGENDICLVKRVKTFGALWHYTHQLCLAEEHDKEAAAKKEVSETTAETMNIQATGLKMTGSK